PDRLEQAIIAVIGEAGIDPLAARWLDFKLLGTADARLAERTFEWLSKAEFGDASEDAVPLGARILIESINHSLFRAIQHGEPRLQTLAWESLKAFTFSPEVVEAQRAATLERRAADRQAR